eukprot:TRINITY_DN23470_c0_g1_i2.p1 TRINITY_DN23470_c0_g1~~TRINITY_DN23470_c0_g1_i2.p1  ORF type:complete len:122 (-),score=23.86 TRINITY_DN23470_c0_g1_i2:98-463(-)
MCIRDRYMGQRIISLLIKHITKESIMNIVPRDPWFNMDNFFDDLFTHRHLIEKEGPFKPRVDIIDKDDSYVFIAELPGVEKEDINVNIQDGILTIEAKMNCLLYTSPSPRDLSTSRMPSSA